jgi:hypothetical protein
MSAYRVAAVVVAEPEVAWASKPKEAFARGEKRYTRKMLAPIVFALGSVAVGVVVMFYGPPLIGVVLFFLGIIVGKIGSKTDRFHDPTVAVHDHAQDDLVAWGERIAEAEGPRLLGSAIAGVIFGAAAEREGARRTALEYYEAALDDATVLHPEAIVREVVTIAAVRGAKAALDLGEQSRARALLEKRIAILGKKIPENLAHLPSLLTCKRFAELAANPAAELDDLEERLYASPA